MHRAGILALATALVTAGTSVPQWVSEVTGSVAQAAEGTGTGGSFVPVQQKLFDTRTGLGNGGVVAPVAANSSKTIQVTGAAGIPSTGVSSVVVTASTFDASALGFISLGADANTGFVAVVFDPNVVDSNTAVVDVSSTGTITLGSNQAVNVAIEVQGYFATGNGTPAPGGYVSVGAQGLTSAANVAAGSAIEVQATGNLGIPSTATAIFANITVVAPAGNDGWLTAWPTQAPQPATKVAFTSEQTTTLGMTIDLNSSGRFSLINGGVSGPVTYYIDVFGYFDGQPSNGGYNTVQGRALDTRTNNTPIPGGGFIDVTVGGVAGLPVYSPSITAFALNITAIADPNFGHLTIWPSDLSEPAVNSVEYGHGNVTNLVLVRPGTDNKIKIRNTGSDPVNVVIDSQGWFTNTGTLPPAVGTDPSRSGDKGSWSLIKQSLNDRTQAAINPVTGNLLLTQQLLSMTGVGPGVSIGIRYNAINDQRPTLNTGLFEGQLFRNATNTEILYTAPDGGSYRFSPNGNGTYVVPRDINAHLTRTVDGSPGASSGPGATYELVFHPDQTKNVYVSDGANLKLVRTEDTTGANKIFYNYAGGKLTSITDTQGRVINYAYTAANNPTQPSSITDTSLNRTISFTYNSATAAVAPGALATVTDATGAVTTYAYGANGKVSSVTDGRGSRTDFTYISGAKLSTLVAGANNSAISATWTMAYPTSAKSTATDPRGKLYTIEFPTLVAGGPTGQVSKITDPRGKITNSVLNSHGDVTERKNALNDTTKFDVAGNTFNLNKTTSPTGGTGGTGAAGRTSESTFPTPVGNGATADYRATSTKDAQKNQTNLTYNSWGQTSTAQVGVPAAGGAPLGGTLTWKYQGETGITCGGKVGQLCQQIDAKGTITAYSYNSAGNLATIDNPAPLGDESFVYDAAGRVVAMTDGKGQTRNTCYDRNDRITQVSYTSSACATASGVTYAYDAAGNRTSTIDASGTTTYTYDALNRPTLLDRSGTAQDSAATYDRASNVLTYVDGGTGSSFTTSYGYDDANNLTSLAEPGGSCPAGAVTPNSTKCTLFTVDDTNKRTKTDFPNGTDTNVVYDTSGRMASVTTIDSTPGSAPLVKREYAYTDATNADTALITKTTDQAGSYTNYAFDTMNRLTAAMTKNSGGTITANSAWTFDVNSNRTQQNANGVITNYGYNAADQLCWSGTGTSASCTAPSGATTYAYDGNGNQTSGGMSYNAYDQLTGTTTGGTTSYNYAGSSNNTRYTAGGATFTNSLMGQLTARAGTNVDAKFIRDPQGALIAFQSAGSSFYYTRDNVDSVLLLTGPAQTAVASYTYDAYGNTLTATGTQAGANPYRYATGYLDAATGLYKMGARYYNPVIGRFTQTDPSGQEDNNYVYAGANPIIYNDPSGLGFWSTVGSWVGGVVGTAAGLAACSASYVTAASCGTSTTLTGLSGSVGGGFLGAAFGNESVSTSDVGNWAATGVTGGAGFGVYKGLTYLKSKFKFFG